MTPTWWVTKIKTNKVLTLSNNEKVELTWKLTICYEENKEYKCYELILFV